MIVSKNTMKQIESQSGFSIGFLMEKAGHSCAGFLQNQVHDKTVILCGKGNNGGDGFVIAEYLPNSSVCLVDGMPATPEALAAYSRLPSSQICEDVFTAIETADCIIDCIYGFGFHGTIPEALRPIFQKVNQSHAAVYSIDINSGACTDSDQHDEDAIISDVTLALDCYKPFHMMQKEHGLFDRVVCIDLELPHTVETEYYEMDEKRFFQQFPLKQVDAYKGIYGKPLFIAGSYGMAGAAALNILGARCTGSSYIQCACPTDIYPIVASHYMTPVFFPFHENSVYEVIEPLIYQSRAIAFGSGCVHMPKKMEIFDLILQSADCPVVLDAEAIRLLNHNYYILKFLKIPVILTPHIGEFAALVNHTISEVRANKFELARNFAKEYNVTIVLKGLNTIVVSPDGKCYINQSGNQVLAQAGSGDLLTGILCSMLTIVRDRFQAVIMAVWLHGHLADMALEKHSYQAFYLEHFEQIADEFFSKKITG